MTCEALTPDTLACDLRQVPALKALLDVIDTLDSVAVGDGNLNRVNVVSSRANPAQSVLVQHALPCAVLVGKGWPLTRHRADWWEGPLISANPVSSMAARPPPRRP